MKTLAVIPARYDSQRFPGKVLAELAGKPVIQHVWERARQAARVDDVVIATDSRRVARAAEGFGAPVFLSQTAHACGTDRVAEVARALGCDLAINIQTDEPMMEPLLIDALVDLFEAPQVQFASAVAPIHSMDDFLDPNVVKVVCDEEGNALYFSRAPIPWDRERPPAPGDPLPPNLPALKHIGIYLYRNDALQRLAALPRSPLEIAESLEQLRVLQQGWKMRILEWDYRGIGLDTEADLQRLRAALE
jgi:3-deoxy-manno-octulosonate cytidylyltransferase (CMP-KDO synthetase)